MAHLLFQVCEITPVQLNTIALLLLLLLHLILYVFILFSSVSCKNCNSILNGEYMGKDGIPYCEKCYQKLFGVKCAYCNRYISGKVLQAGDNHHFHPTCARCTKCGITYTITYTCALEF